MSGKRQYGVGKPITITVGMVIAVCVGACLCGALVDLTNVLLW